MFQSLHAMLASLEVQRRNTESKLGHLQIGVASCAVLDALIRRVRLVTDVVPADAKITRSAIRDHSDDAIPILQFVPATLRKMGKLARESADVVYEQRQPFSRLVGRIESEGYAVDVDTFATVTDARDWSVLDGFDDPDLRVQLEAEKITRAEQAVLYQQRLEQMDEAITKIEAGYSQQIRALVTPDLGLSSP